MTSFELTAARFAFFPLPERECLKPAKEPNICSRCIKVALIFQGAVNSFTFAQRKTRKLT